MYWFTMNRFLKYVFLHDDMLAMICYVTSLTVHTARLCFHSSQLSAVQYFKFYQDDWNLIIEAIAVSIIHHQGISIDAWLEISTLKCFHFWRRFPRLIQGRSIQWYHTVLTRSFVQWGLFEWLIFYFSFTLRSYAWIVF